MAYIGKEPIVGNFQKCDAITVVNGQAAYTLQVSSTNVVPESANHMLVSLNGILQAPVTSFTVSGATLTFVSNLATGDVIDFVILLGNVLDLGTPSDGTVTNAKLAQDIISAETALASTPADTDEFLVSDAGTLKRIDYSLIKGGISSAQEFRLQADQAGSGSTETVLTNWGENNTDYQAIGSAWSQSSGIFSCSSTGIYLCTFQMVILGASGNDAYDPSVDISTDSGSNYNTRATAWEYVSTSDTGASCGTTFMFDVATAGTFRLKFKQSDANDVGTTSTIKGDASQSETNIVFVRLGDT